MVTYTIINEGYAYTDQDGIMHASPTTVFIQTPDKKILVDPGANSKALLKGLAENNIKPNDIDYIFLTHYHLDHLLNIRFFPNTKIVDGEIIWDDEKEIMHNADFFGSDITIIPTPGHAIEQHSLLLDTSEGLVCVAQDIFWWEDGMQNTDELDLMLNFSDPYAQNMKDLGRSRRLILGLADWIIPGHGKVFQNKFKLLLHQQT